jgi:hypothetical protein
MMIDWISVIVPIAHSEPINGGNVVSVDIEGNVEWKVEKRISVEGSHGSTIQIKSDHSDGPYSGIRLDGNPVKWLQGHNVWGSSDLVGLITACLSRVLLLVSPAIANSLLSPSPVESLAQRSAVAKSTERTPTASEMYILGVSILPLVYCARITRIDLNSMYDLGNSQRVLSWIRAAANSANMSHRGKGQFKGDTLYWGKNSRRWSLKMYPKGDELKAHKPKKGIVDHPHFLEGVTNFADRALRVELTLRGMELKDKQLSSVQHWREGVAENVYISYLSGLEFSQNMKVTETPFDYEPLPARLRACALAWSEGHDLRTLYPRATWFRYRKEIMALISLDISLPPPRERSERSNVIPLFTILEAKPMDIPEWARGTPLYFEPPVYRHKFLSVA